MRPRATLIKLVHMGARKLFPEDEDRRAWQKTRTGHASCKDMSDRQLDSLVGELRQKGAIENRPPRRAGRVPFNRSPYMRKIEAQLADMKLPWSYAEALAWRITGGKGLKPHSQPGVERLEWVRSETHFRAIIAALHVEQKKRGTMQFITEMLRDLGLDFDYVDDLLPAKLRGVKWQRHLPTLEAVAEHLDQRLLAKKREDRES